VNKCLLGISGGIDSLFAAKLLKERGFEVVAVCLHLASKKKLSDYAVDFLKKNKIDFFYEDCSNEFHNKVVDFSIKQYLEGLTPNPCAYCNRDVKLKCLASCADRLNIRYIATGHYAVYKNGFLYKHKSRKDQSYFLSLTDKKILDRAIFPLENYSKDEVKNIINIKEKESSDLCFDYRASFDSNVKKPGSIVKDGKVVGEHKGFYNYTIGQRKGIKVGNVPHYVTHIDPKNNVVFVGEERDLYSNVFSVEILNLFVDESFFDDRVVNCVLRYNAAPKKCVFERTKKKVTLFEEERAVTKGQIAVFYLDDKVLGAGRIV